MTSRWFLRWRARLDVIAMRLGYLAAGPEHRLAATITEFDDDGVYRCRVMYVRDVEPWVRSEWERVDPVMALD